MVNPADVAHSEPAFAPSNGITICYETFGDPADPPALLIMGLAAQMIVWDDDFCRELAARGRYVIRFDNRDIGLSTHLVDGPAPSMLSVLASSVARRPSRAPYTLRDMALDSIGLLDALGIASAHVIGVSMGGAIAQEMAIHHRNRVRSLTSIMSSTGDTKVPPPTFGALGVLLARPSGSRAAYLEQYVKRWHLLAGDSFPFDPERTRAQAARGYERGIDPSGVARQMMAIVASGNRKAGLRALNVPALVIHGTIDPLMRFKAAIDLRDTIPGAKLLAIEGMGHTLPRGAWPRILGAIEDLTSDAEAAA